MSFAGKIVVPPKNVTVILNKDGRFTCEASGEMRSMKFLVNGTYARFDNIAKKGFNQGKVNSMNGTSSLTLTANGRKSNNNSRIVCNVFPNTNTEPVFFKVQGNMNDRYRDHCMHVVMSVFLHRSSSTCSWA